MKYVAYRPNIKSGDLLIWSSNNFKARLIKLFTASPFTHVGVAWHYRGRLFALEAVSPRVRIYPLSELLPFNVIHLNKPLTAEAEDVAFSHVGTAVYSELEAIKGLFKLTSNNSLWQCAEYTRIVLQANQIELDCKDTPAEIVKTLLAREGSSMVYLE